MLRIRVQPHNNNIGQGFCRVAVYPFDGKPQVAEAIFGECVDCIWHAPLGGTMQDPYRNACNDWTIAQELDGSHSDRLSPVSES